MESFDYKLSKYQYLSYKLLPSKLIRIFVYICSALTIISTIAVMFDYNPIIISIPVMVMVLIAWFKILGNIIEYFRVKKYCKTHNLTLEEFDILYIANNSKTD